MTLPRQRSLVAPMLCALVWSSAGSAAASDALELIPDFKFTLPVLIVLFFTLVPVLRSLLFEPLLDTLQAREDKIDGARKQADRVMHQAETTLAGYEARILDARAESEQGRKAVLDDARREYASAVARERGGAERTIEHARSEIRDALEQARTQLRGESHALAREAATRILGRSL